jgi:hypothetical protein
LDDRDSAVSDNGFAHLHPDVKPFAELESEERIAFIRKPRWIEYPAATRVQDKIHDILT